MLKKDNNDFEVSKSTLVFFSIFLFAIIFVVIYDDGSGISIDTNIYNKDVVGLFNNIDNNYTMTIEKNYNDKTINYSYYTDSKIKLYEEDTLEYGYLKYNDNVYKMYSENLDIYKVNEYPNYIDDFYTDYNFIKKVVNKCEFEYLSKTNANCKLLITDYINEYNNYNNTNINGISSDYINIDIHYTNKISSIELDYSKINNILYGNNDNIKYKITFSSINDNDFSEIIDYFEDKL